jgi:2-C-methyl-D-erythritol 4-phosphate cytidylyltransferase
MNKIRTTIIVAGGKGERMNAVLPKQFLEMKGKPVLMHTLDVFHRFDPQMPLILVLSAVQIDFWKELCKKHAFTTEHQIVEGGNTRFQSVKNGLAAVSLPATVAVHDGVRPLVSVETISRCFAAAEKSGATIPVTDVVESLRRIEDNRSTSVDRNQYKLVQTPQIFDGELLLKAYEQEFSPVFTDDASVVEAFGHKIELVEGNKENIKITTPFDLKVASVIISNPEN